MYQATTKITKEMWYLLLQARGHFRNDIWEMRREIPSGRPGYEYSICQHALRCGFSHAQTIEVVRHWWRKHHILDGDEARLRHYTLPGAWMAVRDYVYAYRAQQAARKAARRPRTTAQAIIDLLTDTTSPTGASAIAEQSGISIPAARRMLERLAAAGRIQRIGRGLYAPLPDAGEIEVLELGDCRISDPCVVEESNTVVQILYDAAASERPRSNRPDHLLGPDHGSWQRSEDIADLAAEILQEGIDHYLAHRNRIFSDALAVGVDIPAELDRRRRFEHIQDDLSRMIPATDPEQRLVPQYAVTALARQDEIRSFFSQFPVCSASIRREDQNRIPVAA